MRAPPARRAHLTLAALAGAAVAVGGCRRARLPAEAARDFGDTRAAFPDTSECLRLARAVVERRADADASAAARGVTNAPGRRLVLVAWNGGRASIATANAPTLGAAVAAAARALAAKDPDAAAGRIEIDVPTRLDGAALDEDTEVAPWEVGLDGFLATRDDGRTGVVLPAEIVERSMFHDRGRARVLDHAAVDALLADRAGVAPSELASMRAYRFRADARVESPAHDAALSTVRGMTEPPPVDPPALLVAVRRGADYLTRMVDASGRYVYLYRAAADRDGGSYGWLRHAGTTYALFEAYGEFGDARYLEKGELALRRLAARLAHDGASEGEYLLDTDDEEQQKVGGAGLALLAWTEHAAVTGERDAADLETMRSLARFILHQQYADGHFRSNADVRRETGRTLKREAIYYPGEAVLGLIRLYAIDPQPAYLEGARKGADYVVRVRDAYASEDNQEHDHWMSYAFDDLYRVTHDEAYLGHAYKIARAILKKVHRAPSTAAPDFASTFYEGQTTPAATRLEALDADIALSRFAGRPDGWLLTPAREIARSILWQQFDRANDYWLKDPARAAGGVRESPLVNDVRIDYVQHAMSAWLHLARILRDPAYGKTGVPSQDPVRGPAAGVTAR